MDYKIQIISFIFSFIFGGFFYITSVLNYHFITKYPKIFKYLITLVYILDIALLYILFMYKINYGVIHIYFVIVLFLGFYVASIYSKKLRKICKIKKNKLSDKI